MSLQKLSYKTRLKREDQPADGLTLMTRIRFQMPSD
jgi:hypothetical protein